MTAIVERELKRSARQRRLAWVRISPVIATLCAICAFSDPKLLSTIDGASALLFLEGLFMVLFSAIALLQVSCSVTSEKEQGTWWLVLGTGLNGGGVAAGLFAGRLLPVLQAFMGAVPLLFLPMMLGSVTMRDAIEASALVASVSFAAAGIGLAVSSIAQNEMQDIVRGWSVLLAYALGPLFLDAILFGTGPTVGFTQLGQCSLLYPLLQVSQHFRVFTALPNWEKAAIHAAVGLTAVVFAIRASRRDSLEPDQAKGELARGFGDRRFQASCGDLLSDARWLRRVGYRAGWIGGCGAIVGLAVILFIWALEPDPYKISCLGMSPFAHGRLWIIVLSSCFWWLTFKRMKEAGWPELLTATPYDREEASAWYWKTSMRTCLIPLFIAGAVQTMLYAHRSVLLAILLGMLLALRALIDYRFYGWMIGLAAARFSPSHSTLKFGCLMVGTIGLDLLLPQFLIFQIVAILFAKTTADNIERWLSSPVFRVSAD